VTLLEELAWIRTPWEMTGEKAPVATPSNDPPPWETDDGGETIPPTDPINPPPVDPTEIPPDSPDPFAPGR
jgi:hypothetical protein